MINYDYIFFDLDGTLSDSAPGIVDSVLYALFKMGKYEPDRASLTRFVGPPLPESFAKYYGFEGEEIEKAVEHFREYYREKGILGNVMYEGVGQMLKTLRDAGKHLAVSTSKPEVYARVILERYGIDDNFEFIAGSLLDNTRVNKADVIKYTMESLNLSDPSAILMVGDRAHDVIGSARFGIDCMGVLYGYGSREELEDAGAKYFAATVEDISEMILK